MPNTNLKTWRSEGATSRSAPTYTATLPSGFFQLSLIQISEKDLGFGIAFVVFALLKVDIFAHI